MAATSALEWHRFFGWDVAIGVGAAAIAPAVIAVGLTIRSSSARQLWVTGTVSLLGLGVVLVVVASPSGAIDGLIDGWSRLLTRTVPTPAEGQLLVMPLTVVWLSGAIAAETALRVRRPLAGLVAVAPAYAVPLVYTAAAEGNRLTIAVVIAVLGFLAAHVLRPGSLGASVRDGLVDAPASSSGLQRTLGLLIVAGISIGTASVVRSHLPFAEARPAFEPVRRPTAPCSTATRHRSDVAPRGVGPGHRSGSRPLHGPLHLG